MSLKLLEELNVINKEHNLGTYYIDSMGNVKLKHRISEHIAPESLSDEIEFLIGASLGMIDLDYPRIIRAIEGREFDASQASRIFD